MIIPLSLDIALSRFEDWIPRFLRGTSSRIKNHERKPSKFHQTQCQALPIEVLQSTLLASEYLRRHESRVMANFSFFKNL